MRQRRTSSGFTLIELLVIIAIIGILSSIVLVSLNTARTKAKDTQRVTELRELSKALTAYFVDTGSFPPNVYSGVEVRSNDPNFLPMLVSGGYISRIPPGPAGNDYAYYNYGSGSAAGAFLRVPLAGDAASLTGRPGSCRPFTNNWCSSTQLNSDYCLCNPY